MRDVFLAGEEAQEGAALQGEVIADRAPQHGVAGFEGVEDRLQRDGAIDFERYFLVDMRQGAQMRREHDLDHGNVCTSTEKTAGRLLAMGAQLSPESFEAYTCPPVVPK